MVALPRAALALAALLGVSSAVLEVHVGTGLVFSVEGQRVVLPAWYTSHSQKKPYITWLLDKEDADPFQILTYMDGVTKVEETELKPRVGFLYPVLTHNISLFINATRGARLGPVHVHRQRGGRRHQHGQERRRHQPHRPGPGQGHPQADQPLPGPVGRLRLRGRKPSGFGRVQHRPGGALK
ncbi:unnamed protein product [Bubo scandiacus]